MAQSGKRFSQCFCMAFKLLFDIYPFAWHVNDVRMACERHKRVKFEFSHSKGVTATQIATLNVANEIKVRRIILPFKILIYVVTYHESQVHFTFSVNFISFHNVQCQQSFFCEFRLLKFTMRKNKYNLYQWQYSTREIVRQFGSWQNIFLIIRPIYEKTFVAKEANKLSM